MTNNAENDLVKNIKMKRQKNYFAYHRFCNC